MKNFFIILCLVFVSIASARIPDYIHVCHRNDPALSKCIIQSVEALKPKLKTGIPELAVPSLEPLILAPITISGGHENSFYKAVGKNVEVYGASNFKVTKLKVDLPNLTFFVGVNFPYLRFFSDIDVNGRFLLTPIKAKGQLETNATNVIGHAVIKANIKEINGENKMVFNMNLDLKSADLNVRLSNLFGDEIIGQIVNDAVAQNKNDVFKILKPIAEETATKILLEIINKIAKNFSYDEIFPE